MAKTGNKSEGYRVEFHGPDFDIDLGDIDIDAFWVVLAVYCELVKIREEENGED